LIHRRLLAACLAAGALLSPAIGVAQAEAPPVAAIPLEDPWLTERGPILAEPPAPPVAHDRVALAWSAAPPTPHARTAALRRQRLEFGLGDLRAPAEVIRAIESADDESVGTSLALELAPGMPSLQWAHALDLWHHREQGAAARAFGTMLWQMAHELDAQIWLLGNGLLLVLVVVLGASAAFIAMLALKSFPHAAHDLADPLSNRMPAFARAALLAGCLLVPLALGEGVAGLVLACFAVAFLYGKPRERSVLAMAAVFFVVALHPLAQWASVAATVVDLDPLARSALAVTKGVASSADVERLEAAFDDDLVAAHAIAYRARRHAEDDLEKDRLDALAARYHTDPVVLANLGNIEMRAGRTDAAIDLYERAAGLVDSPTLLFDLSQAYASVLRMSEYEATIERAQRLGDREVAALSSLSDPRLVGDLPFPIERVRDRLRTLALAEAPEVLLTASIAPGRLGDGWLATAIGFSGAALAAAFLGGRFERSSACGRCAGRICGRCGTAGSSEDLCEDCHHLFRNIEATDPKLRMARLQVLSRREAWRSGALTVASLVVPGVAGLAMRRPDMALLSLVLFATCALWLRWPSGMIVDPLWIGPLVPFAFAALASASLLAYAAIVVGSLVSRRSR